VGDAVWVVGGFLMAAVLLGPAALRRYQHANGHQPVGPLGQPPAPVWQPFRPPHLIVGGALALTVMMAARPGYGLLAAAWLAAAFVAGMMLTDRFFPGLPVLLRLCTATMAGMVTGAWVTFALAMALNLATDNAVLLAGVLWPWGTAAVAWRLHWRPRREMVCLARSEVLVLVAALAFSAWMHDHALSYVPQRDEIQVSNGSWSDFSLHFSFARSFSFGDNLPPQYVYFAGPAIHYHFGFDFLAGLLERLGLRMDLAFNVPAVLSFAIILAVLFDLGRFISGYVFGGIAAALLMVLSNSWAFIDYVKLWRHTPRGFLHDFWNQKDRLHIGPYNPQTISSHFTLIPYIDQRQLTVAVAGGVVVVALLIRRLRTGRRLTDTQAAALGAFLGLMFPLNGVVYVAIIAAAGALLLAFWRVREGTYFGLYAIAVAMPSVVLLRGDDGPKPHLGYLNDFTGSWHSLSYVLSYIKDFGGYWWENFGLLLPLVLLALVLGPWKDRRIIVALFAPFIVGNAVQLGRDLSGINHKLFNFWSVLMAIYGGVMLARIAYVRTPWPRLRLAGPLAVALLLPVLTFSGFIDIVLFKNESRVDVIGPDRPVMAWIAEHTSPHAVFLTTPYFYQPPNAAGRLQYLGWAPFPDSAGYNVKPREDMVRLIYGASGPAEACPLLRREGIDYVQIGPAEAHPDSKIPVNQAGWAKFRAAYDFSTPFGPLRYYSVKDNCG